MKILKGIKRVAFGLSGGVDSAVGALLLKRQGFEVIGVFMKNWDLSDETGFCNIESEVKDVEFVCSSLGIPFNSVNFVKEYWNQVFTKLIDDYQNGLTPNPDILCNKHIKFNQFYDYAKDILDCNTIATGHYANNSFGDHLEHRNLSGAYLLKAEDRVKDQTFFLSQIPQRTLQNTLFPLGKFKKENVKAIAFENNLERIAKKKESMGICFIGSRHFQSFINDYIKPQEGNFIDAETGVIVGKHLGKHNWTIGQRCNIPGVKTAYYIAFKTKTQDIYVTQGHNHPILYSTTLTAHQSYWIHSEPADLLNNKVFHCQFRFQHGKPLINCNILSLGSGKLHIILEKPLRAITCGQYAVFYKGHCCLGSAIIDYVGPTEFALNHQIQKDSLV